jgi:oxygen-independent coproporphyrinogen-3 oxidase
VLADEMLEAANFSWYEVSNWAKPGGQCQHNLAYWRGDHWWGVGPGAHSHVAGLRWWNVKHPSAYATRLAAGRSPGHAREHLDAGTRRLERVMLALRLAEGLDVGDLDDSGMKAATAEAESGLLDAGRLGEGRAVLTRAGRLLADGVARRLLG